jgi:hypothetical protein
MILSNKRLAWMLEKSGGVKLTWTITAEAVDGVSPAQDGTVVVYGAMHRHQPERSREQKAVYSAEGEIPQPHLCFMVRAADLEGKPFAEETRPVSKGMRVTAALEGGDMEYRVEKCELAPDQSHYVIEVNEDAQ